MKGYGEIYIPPYPIRDITPTDVYEIVKRLEAELIPFIKNEKFLQNLKLKRYTGKTPNDVYRLLWSISLAFDELLGIHGYTPTDVYALSLKLLDNVKFLRQTQNIYKKERKPKYIDGLYPNHALKHSYIFLKKVREAEKHLWIEPTDVPEVPQKVITPTEVYDSIQYNLAELQRIKYRLGFERYFKEKKIDVAKTPSDVVVNLKYATLLMPTFDFDQELIQYSQKSLNKTPNHVFAVTEEILKKITLLKNIRGIVQKPKNAPFIEGLRPIHAYQKAIEATEKAIRLKEQMGFYPSQIPRSPIRPITPNEVYEIVLRLDGIVTILLKKSGYKNVDEYIYKLDKHIPNDKTPSNVYHNLWMIANNFDLLTAGEYTPNETYKLSKKIENKVVYMLKKLHIKKELIKFEEDKNIKNKFTKDLFALELSLFEQIKKMQKRLNMRVSNIIIPKEKDITQNTVYNALRIINASINEILIHIKAEEEEIVQPPKTYTDKTTTDVYKNVQKIYKMVNLLFDKANYDR